MSCKNNSASASPKDQGLDPEELAELEAEELPEEVEEELLQPNRV